MNYISKTNFQFLDIENRVSKKDQRPYQMIILGDPERMERTEFYKTDELNISHVKRDDLVQAEINITRIGFNDRIQLVSLTKVNK